MTPAAMIKTIQRHMRKIANQRDKLDESISQMNALKENCDHAYDCLQEARDALSESV